MTRTSHPSNNRRHFPFCAGFREKSPIELWLVGNLSNIGEAAKNDAQRWEAITTSKRTRALVLLDFDLGRISVFDRRDGLVHSTVPARGNVDRESCGDNYHAKQQAIDSKDGLVSTFNKRQNEE